MSNTSSTLQKITWGLCFLLGIVLSFKALREPDLWWMYRTGEWMLENGAVTKNDPFSYTFSGVEWINVKWLFEVLIASGKALLGVEFIFVLQAFVTGLIIYLLATSSRVVREQFASAKGQEISPSKVPSLGFFLALFLALFTIDFRLIGRPEMTSHLMVSAYLCLFWRYHQQPSKLIFALVPLQILWTNMHEAFGIGMVLMLAYLAATWLQYWYFKQQKTAMEVPKWLSWAVLAALVGIVINPRGPQMWLHPFEIFGQLQTNQYTTELAPIWKFDYWKKEAYFNGLFLFLSLGFVLLTPRLLSPKKTPSKKEPDNSTTSHKKANSKAKKTTKNSKKAVKPKATNPPKTAWLLENLKIYGMGNGLLICMLLYLSTTAYRNIPFFILASTPIVALALDQLLSRWASAKWLPGAILGLGLCFYGSIISGKYHEWSGSRDQYGLQVLASHNPIGASNFIQEHDIKGTCFSDYLTSAYLLWDLQPDFKTFIDLRDLDIFPATFFTEFSQAVTFPPVFESIDDSLKFDYVVLFRPQFPNLHQHLLESEEYHLVFVDPVACVYLKNLPQHQALIKQYGFEANNYPDIFSSLQPIPSSSLAYGLSKLFNPLYQTTTYQDTDEDAIAGSYYLGLNQTELAFARAKQSIEKGVEPWKGHELLGNLYNNLAFNPTTPDSLRSNYTEQAYYYYGQAIEAKPDYVSAIVGKGTLPMQQQDFTTAVFIYNQALEIDPNNVAALQYLSMCYKVIVNQQQQKSTGTVQQWLEYSQKLNQLTPDNPYVHLDMGLAYCSLGNCVQAVQYLSGVINVEGMPVEELKTAKRCLKQCGGL